MHLSCAIYGTCVSLHPSRFAQKKWGPARTARAAVIYLEEIVRVLLSAQQVADSGGDEKAGKADSATFLQLEDVVEGILRSRYRPLRARYRQYFLERKQQQQHVLTEAAAAAAPSPGSTGAEGDVESLMAVPAQRERSQVSSSKLTVAEPDSSLHTNCIPCSALFWEQGLGNLFMMPGPGTHPVSLSPMGRATVDFQAFVDR